MVSVQVDLVVHRCLLSGDFTAMTGPCLGALDCPVAAFGEVADLGVEAGLHHLAHCFDPGLARFGDTAVDPHVAGYPGYTTLADQHLPVFALQKVFVELEGFLSFFSAGGAQARWHHGAVAAVTLTNCRVAETDVLAADAAHRLQINIAARHAVQMAAINIGVARAAYEAAIDYAKMRWQGGRYIVEHQAIGMKLADVAIQLEAARGLTWKAAWLADHPEAVADRSVSDLPWAVVVRTFTAESLHRATLEAAECFGAMGVMRDMPLQKYVHDTLVLRHATDCDLAAPLVVAEAVAGSA